MTMRLAIILMAAVGLAASAGVGVLLGVEWGAVMAACVIVCSFFAGAAVVVAELSRKKPGRRGPR